MCTSSCRRFSTEVDVTVPKLTQQQRHNAIGCLQAGANQEGRKGNVLFNDALNTFYLQLYGVGHMVKDHSDSERGNPLLPHGLLFPISSKGSFIMHHPTDRIAHTTAS